MNHADPLSERRRKCIEYVDCWVKPSSQSLVTASRLFEMVDLVLKYSQNVRGRVACLEPGNERMCDNILLCLYFVGLEGFLKSDIETGRGCRCVRLRAGSKRLTHVEGMVITLKFHVGESWCGALGHVWYPRLALPWALPVDDFWVLLDLNAPTYSRSVHDSYTLLTRCRLES